MAYQIIACTPKALPRGKQVAAADNAARINPLNRAPIHRLASLMPGFVPTREHIAVVTTKYWHANGKRFTVSFLDNPPADLRARILLHMNAWSSRLNISFVASNTDPEVRIARTQGDGYWSYVGTDIQQIPADQPTMNLESFSMTTPESEYHRVVRHETGHTLGCPHEHMRAALVAKIDEQKAIDYFGRTQGWDADEVRRQVLTPIEASSILGTATPDPNSIMCYQIPGIITKDGQTIPGGNDIDQSDYDFMAGIYPKPKVVVIPPPKPAPPKPKPKKPTPMNPRKPKNPPKPPKKKKKKK